MKEKKLGGARPGAGRKPGVYGPKGKAIRQQISMPEADWQAVEKAATKLGMTKSAFVREAIKRYLASLEEK